MTANTMATATPRTDNVQQESITLAYVYKPQDLSGVTHESWAALLKDGNRQRRRLALADIPCKRRKIEESAHVDTTGDSITRLLDFDLKSATSEFKVQCTAATLDSV